MSYIINHLNLIEKNKKRTHMEIPSFSQRFELVEIPYYHIYEIKGVNGQPFLFSEVFFSATNASASLTWEC